MSWRNLYLPLIKLLYGFETQRVSCKRAALLNILRHAKSSVPFYRETFHQIDFDSSSVIEQIGKLPTLSRDDVISKSHELISLNKKRNSYWNSSGGSTGQPVRILQDKYYLQAVRCEAYQQEKAVGYKLGDRRIKLWGDEREVLKGSSSLKSMLINLLKNQCILNAFTMTSEKMKAYINLIGKYRPVLIEAYAQPMYDLVNYADQNGLELNKIGSIITSAGTLHDFMRERIESYTRCKVYNRYGSREVGAIACDHPDIEGMRIASTVYVETIRQDGSLCDYGEEGEIVVTSLINYSMPLIRYRIGDRGILDKLPSGEVVLCKIAGRVTEAFYTKDKKTVPAEYFIHLLGVVMNDGLIKQFQILQNDFDDIEVKMVASGEVSPTYEDKVADVIRKAMGDDCKVAFSYVEDIPKNKSGKYVYTLSRIKDGKKRDSISDNQY